MDIRLATKADIPALQDLLRKSWLTTWAPALSGHTAQKFRSEDIAGRYAQENFHAFHLVEMNGELVGVFRIEKNYLHAIELDPDRKRQGIGSLLMDQIECMIAGHYSEAVLEVRAFNVGAIAFYKQRGWVIRRTFEGTECGEVVETFEMAKSLKPQ